MKRLHGIILLSAATIIAASGCSDSAESAASPAPVFPESVEVDGVTWQYRGEIDPADMPQIEQQVQRYPGIADYEELNGLSATYGNSDGISRHTWMTSSTDSVLWFYMEFNGQTFVDMQSGRGELFSEPPSSVEVTP